jgi:hypothetical protein
LTALVSLVIFISFLNHIFALLATLLKMKNKFSFLTSGYRDVTGGKMFKAHGDILLL